MTKNSLEDRIKSSKRRYHDALENLEAMAHRCLSLGMDDDFFEPSSSIESAAFHLIQESNQLRSLLTVKE
jgi:phage gp36-like protein